MPLLYDADCGFCTRAARSRLLRGAQPRPLQSVDLAAMGVDAVRAQREVPHVAADGAVTYGAAAVAAALRTSDRRRHRLLGRLLAAPVVRLLAGLGYRLVAANRHRLPGATTSCGRPA